ncbi:hypothetical protein IGI04_002811 [Brassica rapa subsp. trilocularis]|uniref:Uncharacterized protein n=1 Tax=Brassica rapa subsp. trilocularis TaxID=1813537 RepID=A0ABQ7NZY5_BRACM|nr:hypothetical protein IGI04_002811 [Brassica rapa subsp. trilocularis]
MAETRSQELLAPESELSLQQLLERLRLRFERPSYAEHRNLQPASAVTTFNNQESVPASTVSEAPIKKQTKKRLTIEDGDEDQLSCDKDSHQDTESLEVYSSASIPESNSNQDVEADSVSQLEEFEKEVSAFSLEPSLSVDQRQSMLLQNIGSQLLVNGSHCVSVWLPPKIEESFILDVELGVQLIQKAVEATDFVEHHLFDQLSLRQLKSQKDWTFKYKLKKRSQHFSDKVCTEKEELQVVVSDSINDGFGWDHFGGYHEEMLRVCATEVEELVPLKYSKTWSTCVVYMLSDLQATLEGCRVMDRLRNFYTQRWQRVAVRGRCDSTHKLMAFYELVQSYWFPKIFCVSNGTGSFTIWHRWRCKAASTLYETKEAEKLKPLTELIADQIKIVCSDEGRVGRIDSSVRATAVEERVLLKLYKSWQLKFRSMFQVQFTDEIETIKWTDCLLQLQQKRVFILWNGQFVLTALQTDHEVVECVKGRQLRSLNILLMLMLLEMENAKKCGRKVQRRIKQGKLLKSWRFKFRGKMETIKWTDSLIDLWKLSVLTLSAWNLMSFMAREESVFLSFISGCLAVANSN